MPKRTVPRRHRLLRSLRKRASANEPAMLLPLVHRSSEALGHGDAPQQAEAAAGLRVDDGSAGVDHAAALGVVPGDLRHDKIVEHELQRVDVRLEDHFVHLVA
jgi:hypothetical protein